MVKAAENVRKARDVSLMAFHSEHSIHCSDRKMSRTACTTIFSVARLLTADMSYLNSRFPDAALVARIENRIGPDGSIGLHKASRAVREAEEGGELEEGSDSERSDEEGSTDDEDASGNPSNAQRAGERAGEQADVPTGGQAVEQAGEQAGAPTGEQAGEQAGEQGEEQVAAQDG